MDHQVVGDITISIDGYVTGPSPGPMAGLGTDGEALHAWVESDHPVDRAALERTMDRTGAVVMGRALFDVVDGPAGWSDDMGYGADLAGRPPLVVVTSSAPDAVRLGLDITFVTEGVAAAVEVASGRAGGADVIVMGGATTIRSCLEAGLLDELRLHVSPELMGGGTPLFHGVTRRSLEQLDVQASPTATHLVYRVARSGARAVRITC